MVKISINHPALVLSMFETGLAIGQSLGRHRITVFGKDYKTDKGFYSKYIKASLCPHPLNQETEFINHLIEFGKSQPYKPVMFIAADDFLLAVSRNRKRLEDYFLINLPDEQLIESINDKFQQYLLAKQTEIEAPKTFFPKDMEEVKAIANELLFPAFIKARDVNTWRARVSSSIKGFLVHNKNELVERYLYLFQNQTAAIVQELILGKDTNHFKVCIYADQKRNIVLTFTLQKIRQLPIRFGVGSVVRSCDFPELAELGRKFFTRLNYKGVGSAEFKIDERDRKLKLIELNPRYWQQNALADACGQNFALTNYADLTGAEFTATNHFKKDVKWINIYMDFASFLAYRKAGEIAVLQWLASLKGKKIFSDFARDDVRPALYEIDFGRKLLNLPKFLLKRI